MGIFIICFAYFAFEGLKAANEDRWMRERSRQNGYDTYIDSCGRWRYTNSGRKLTPHELMLQHPTYWKK